MNNIEFEEKLEGFEKQICNKKIYVFGAGGLGKYVYSLLKEDGIAGFIDNSKEKQKQGIDGKKVFALQEVLEKKEDIFVIIAVAERHYREVYQQLIKELEKEVIMNYTVFIPLYLFIAKKRLLFTRVSVSLTQKCTLNCKHCSIMTPHLKEKKHYELEKMQEDLDLMFDKIDYLGGIVILGGEPFLYPHLKEYLRYLEKYKDRILRKPTIVTNGTLIPSEDILEELEKQQIEVSISDYRAGLPWLKEKIDNLEQVLKNHNINYMVDTPETWFDFGYTSVDKYQLSEEEMSRFFDACKMPCRLLRNGKIYYCANAQFACDVGLMQEDIENELELSKADNPLDIIKFDQGYNARGYLNLCRQCNGYININKNEVPIAEQV